MISSGEVQTFSDTVDEIIELYILLIEASACKTEGGKNDNYAKISNRYDVFNRPVYETWTRRLIDLFESTANRVGYNEKFFDDIVNVPVRLFNRLNNCAHPDILTHFVGLPNIIFRRLAVWWEKTLEQQGIMEHHACKASSLKPPYHETYISLLRHFIGSWESLKNFSFPPRRDDVISWSDIQEAGRYYETHLQSTTIMLVECVNRGDNAGTEWIANVLLSWFSELQFRFKMHQYFFRREKLISYEVMGLSWEIAKETLDVDEGGYIRERAPSDLFAVALRNYWIDVCCIVAYLFAIRGKHCSCLHSLPIKIISSVIYGEAPNPDKRTEFTEPPIKNADDLFIAILRQYHSEGGLRRGYRSRLDHLIERLIGTTKEEMVSGRIYAGWGADDLDSLMDGQIIILMLLVTQNWNPIKRSEKIIREWVREDDTKIREVIHDMKKWKERVVQDNFVEYKEIFEFIRESWKGQSFEEAILSFSSGVDKFIDKIEAIRNERLDELAISNDRLKEVGKWASKLGFNSTTGGFPLSIIKEINITNTKLEERSVLLRGVSKGEFTDPLMAQLASNEEEWFGEMIRDHVAASILMQAINQQETYEKDGSSPHKYWNHMKRYASEAKRNNRNVILIIENRTVPKWIYDWTDTYRENSVDTPTDLKSWRNLDLESESYLGNLNDIAVYQASIPSGVSYLLTAESFKSVSFTRLENGSYVHIEALPSSGDSASINLSLKWWFSLDLDEYPIIKLNYYNSERIQ